jgi:hypothetical protein
LLERRDRYQTQHRRAKVQVPQREAGAKFVQPKVGGRLKVRASGRDSHLKEDVGGPGGGISTVRL